MHIPKQMTAGTSELHPPTSTESHHTDIPVFPTCMEDTICSIGEYCFKGLCEMCLSCESFNRQSPSPKIDGIFCAKEEAQCGSCKPGYEEITYGKQMITCSQIPSAWNYHFRIIYPCLALIFIVLLMLIFLLKKKLTKLERLIYKKLICKKSENSTPIGVSYSVETS